MSNTTTIYSRCITSLSFDYLGDTITFHGMNKHGFNFANGSFHPDLSKEGVPFANPNIPIDAWTFFKNKYGDRSSYFDKRNGDLFFEATSIKEAISKVKDSKPVISDKDLISKQKGIKQIAKNEVE